MNRGDPLITYINFARLMVERDRRIYRECMMAVEIKGLGANMEAAMAAIRKAKVATARMNQSGGILASTALDIAQQFDKHTENLLREASSMGNLPPEDSGDEPETPPVKPIASSDKSVTAEVKLPPTPTLVAVADPKPLAGYETANTAVRHA